MLFYYCLGEGIPRKVTVLGTNGVVGSSQRALPAGERNASVERSAQYNELCKVPRSQKRLTQSPCNTIPIRLATMIIIVSTYSVLLRYWRSLGTTGVVSRKPGRGESGDLVRGRPLSRDEYVYTSTPMPKQYGVLVTLAVPATPLWP